MESLLAYESDSDDAAEKEGVIDHIDASGLSEEDDGTDTGSLLAGEENMAAGEEEENLSLPVGKTENTGCMPVGPSTLQQLYTQQMERHPEKRIKLENAQEQQASKLGLPPPFTTRATSSLTDPTLSSVMWPTAKRKESDGDAKKAKEYAGRVRTFPHVEGNFAVHVYIPVAVSRGLRERLSRVLKVAAMAVLGLQSMAATDRGENKDTTTDHTAPFPILSEYHISLSRVTGVRFEQIDLLVSALRRKLRSQKRYSGMFCGCSFCIEFDRWECFVNDERTRSFLALEILRKGLPEIAQQIKLVDEVFLLHQLPLFYQRPRPHISLAWLLGDQEQPIRMMADDLNEASVLGGADSNKVDKTGISSVGSFEVDFGKVICKIGQREYVVCDTALAAR